MKTSRPKQMTLDPLSSDDLRPELLTSGVTSSVTSGLTCSWPLDWPLMEHQVWPLTSAVTSVTFDLSLDRDQLWEFGWHLSDPALTFTPYASADLCQPWWPLMPMFDFCGPWWPRCRCGPCWSWMPVLTSVHVFCWCGPLWTQVTSDDGGDLFEP